MKKLSLLFTLVLFSVVVANAQEYKKFRWNLGMGYAMPSGSGSKAGVLLHSEPAYRVSDALLVGLRMEFAGMLRGYSNSDLEASGSVSFAGSYALTGQYYFKNGGFRPFAGAGLGIFSLASVDATVSADQAYYYVGTSGSKFGFFPRIGFDAGHFNMALEYNLLGSTKLVGYNFDTDMEDPNAPKVDSKNSYLGIKLGVFIGGGRK